MIEHVRGHQAVRTAADCESAIEVLVKLAYSQLQHRKALAKSEADRALVAGDEELLAGILAVWHETPLLPVYVFQVTGMAIERGSKSKPASGRCTRHDDEKFGREYSV